MRDWEDKASCAVIAAPGCPEGCMVDLEGRWDCAAMELLALAV